MDNILRQYQIHGVGVDIESQLPSLAESVQSILGPYAIAKNGAHGYRIAVAHGEPPSNGEATNLSLVGHTSVNGGREVFWFANSHERVAHLSGVAWTHLDLGKRQGRVMVRPGEEWCLEFGCLTPMLCDVLAHEQHYVFHAATLAVKTRNGIQAILLAGVSGVGKTTTALALARAEMQLLTDDASFLVWRSWHEKSQLKIWGFPRPCKVHRQTLALLKWIDGLNPNPIWREEEFKLDLNRVSPCGAGLEIAPGLLVLLIPRNDCEHRITELDKVAALTEMTRQNVRALYGHAVETAGRSFEALGQLVTASRTVRLSVGPDLPGLGAVLRRCLEE